MNHKFYKNSDVLDTINAWSVRQKTEAVIVILLQLLAALFVVLWPLAIVAGVAGVILHKFGIL